MLLGSLRSERSALTHAWESEKFEELLEHVHKLHGATRYCGVPALRKAACDLETLIKTALAGETQHAELVPAFKELITQMCHLESWEQQQHTYRYSPHPTDC